MECQSCSSKRIMSVGGKSSDCNQAQFNNIEYNGYVPSDIGIGGGDYYEIKYCLDCGQMQGKFPLADPEFIEKNLDPLPHYGDHMSLDDFIEDCMSGGFIDYDGNGRYAMENGISKKTVYPSDIMSGDIDYSYTHIVWFNR